MTKEIITIDELKLLIRSIDELKKVDEKTKEKIEKEL